MTTDHGAAGLPGWMTTYLDAWNSHEPAQIIACMTEDAVRDDKGFGERVEGGEALRASLDQMLSGWSSDFRLEPGDLVAGGGETWAAEWTLTGTNDLDDPAHGIPATGRPFRIQGLSIGRLRDGRIAEERLYWNLADYLGQVGLMPSPAAAGT